jgi:hypothetical protein
LHCCATLEQRRTEIGPTAKGESRVDVDDALFWEYELCRCPVLAEHNLKKKNRHDLALVDVLVLTFQLIVSQAYTGTRLTATSC